MILLYSILDVNKASFSNSYSGDLKVPQYLPLEAELCLLNRQCLLLEVADTPAKKQLGLMERTSLRDGTGMLFPFSPKRIVRFWMYKTLIELDMIFYLDGVVKALEKNVETCFKKMCPIYGPDYAVDGVIELNSGEIEKLGIRIGDKIRIQYQ